MILDHDKTSSVHRRSTLLAAPLLLLMSAGCISGMRAPAPAVPAHAAATRPASADRGAIVYRKACSACHGEAGDGHGPGAASLDPQPSDFTRGTFAYRSTPTGSLPQDDDLVRTVTLGLPGTSMPAWRDLLTPADVLDVVAYVKRFSARFASEEPDAAIDIPEPVPFSAESVEKGRQAYEKVQCGKCHGKDGKGDGWAKESEMRNSLGRVVHARDFTQGVYQSGRSKRDLYRVFYTGLDGTPMPAYEASLPPEQIYHLVNFLLSLEQQRGFRYWLATPPRWYEPADSAVSR
jgi:mono/diheme cytochrome c family protein